MYVANSDFDLQYNGGTVFALDLDRIRNMLPIDEHGAPSCGSLGTNNDRLLVPGPCGAISLTNPPDGKGSLVRSSAEIGAFATDLRVVTRQDGPGARLFVSVRGDPSITWFDVDDDRDAPPGNMSTMDCGQSGASKRCDDAHRAGQDPNANMRRVVLPPEPYGVAATEDGTALLVTHQTSGVVSVLTNPWDGVPALRFVAPGFPSGGIGVAALPVPAYARAAKISFQPGFLVTFRAASEVDLVRFYDDEQAAPNRPFAIRQAAIPIHANAGSYDSRGIAVDSEERKTCEARCASDDLTCLRGCVDVPIHVYIANRLPSSLLIGETKSNASPAGTSDAVEIYDSVPVSAGASRVSLGKIINRQGKPETRVFVSCFDSRFVYIYNPRSHRMDGQIRTGRGPHALLRDPQAPLLYVSHFTDSYIGVVDLDQRHGDAYASMIASIGVPTPPRESK